MLPFTVKSVARSCELSKLEIIRSKIYLMAATPNLRMPLFVFRKDNKMLNKTLQAANNDYSREDFENLIEMFRQYETLVLKVENDMYMLREPSDLGEAARHHARFVLYSDYFATNLVDYAVGISERLVHFFSLTDGFLNPPLKCAEKIESQTNDEMLQAVKTAMNGVGGELYDPSWKLYIEAVVRDCTDAQDEDEREAMSSILYVGVYMIAYALQETREDFAAYNSRDKQVVNLARLVFNELLGVATREKYPLMGFEDKE